MPFSRPVTPQQLEGDYATVICAESGYKMNKRLVLITSLKVNEEGKLETSYMFTVTNFGDPKYVGDSIGMALTIYNNITRNHNEPEPSY